MHAGRQETHSQLPWCVYNISLEPALCVSHNPPSDEAVDVLSPSAALETYRTCQLTCHIVGSAPFPGPKLSPPSLACSPVTRRACSSVSRLASSRRVLHDHTLAARGAVTDGTGLVRRVNTRNHQALS